MIIETDNASAFLCDKVTIGTGKITLPAAQLSRGVQILADSGNTDSIYIGNSDVSTSGKSFPLAAGTGLFVPIDQLNKVNLISTGSNQKIWYFAI